MARQVLDLGTQQSHLDLQGVQLRRVMDDVLVQGAEEVRAAEGRGAGRNQEEGDWKRDLSM